MSMREIALPKNHKCTIIIFHTVMNLNLHGYQSLLWCCRQHHKSFFRSSIRVLQIWANKVSGPQFSIIFFFKRQKWKKYVSHSTRLWINIMFTNCLPLNTSRFVEITFGVSVGTFMSTKNDTKTVQNELYLVTLIFLNHFG